MVQELKQLELELSRLMDIPLPSKGKMEANNEDYFQYCPKDLQQPSEEDKFCQDISINSLGLPYRRIAGGAYPPFFQKAELDRLRKEWTPRHDDVFLIFPAAPISDGFQAFAIALVEQCDVSSVDLCVPRWIDADVSRRGWDYVDALDKWQMRRTLTTKVPPWRFPGNSFRFSCSGSDPRVGPEVICPAEEMHTMPLIAVFVADPRFMMMKELTTALMMARGTCTPANNQIDLDRFLRAMMANDYKDTGGLGILGSSMRTSLAWSRVEASFPENVRIFFMEDFINEPEVAMRGLARFLKVPSLSAETEEAIRKSPQLQEIVRCQPSAVHPQHASDALMTAGVDNLVSHFERTLAELPQEIQAGWQKLVQTWLRSPNSRMVTFATCVLEHRRWDPPKWWAAHNARLCRPCLFFPRGKCDDDQCDYCHGAEHPKPKRPAKNKRAARRRFERTPSPTTPHPPLALKNGSAASSGRSSSPASAQLRYDRTPSPTRVWFDANLVDARSPSPSSNGSVAIAHEQVVVVAH